MFICLYAVNNRFASVSLESLVGQVYSLCKDQHGCRFLQKKLEENSKSYIDMIFNEVYEHFIELITGKLTIILYCYSFFD